MDVKIVLSLCGRLLLLTFECKKLYADLIKPRNFIDKSITDRWYGESHGGFHKMYVVEIVNVLHR